MSHTVGPAAFSPAILSFGSQPRLPIGNYEQQPQTSLNCMEVTTTARCKYEAIVAGLRAKCAMSTVTPHEIVAHSTPGDEVLVYREKNAEMAHTDFFIVAVACLLCWTAKVLNTFSTKLC